MEQFLQVCHGFRSFSKKKFNFSETQLDWWIARSYRKHREYSLELVPEKSFDIEVPFENGILRSVGLDTTGTLQLPYPARMSATILFLVSGNRKIKKDFYFLKKKTGVQKKEKNIFKK